MTALEVMKHTNNNSQYNKARKMFLSDNFGLCPFCPPNKGCNERHKHQKSWKKKTKKRFQYRIKGIE